MATYDAFAENPGFQLWNVVAVRRPDKMTWEFELIGRENECIAMATIRRHTVADLQTSLLSRGSNDGSKEPWAATEDCGITIVSRDACYLTEIQLCLNLSLQYREKRLKSYVDAGLVENPIYKMALRDFDAARAKYDAWKALPQIPLENPLNSKEPLKCYFGLPQIVYMHLVGQLCANI